MHHDLTIGDNMRDYINGMLAFVGVIAWALHAVGTL